MYDILIYAFKIKIQARGGACGHFIFEGPPGVGKRTMIWAMLREAFGRDTIHVKYHDKIHYIPLNLFKICINAIIFFHVP